MAASVFISFASTDRKTAMTICSALEARGFKCWISARDIMPGENFQSAIVKAIRGAKVMLLVFTGNSNASEEMSKELALASQRKMPVIPLRVEDVAPNDAFAYEFATRQWIDFFADWEFAISQLASQISKIIEADPAGKPVATTPVTIETKGKKAAAAAAAAAPAAAPAPEPASFLDTAPAASDADLVGVLDPPADHTFDSDPAAAEAPVRKGPGALLFVGAAVVIAAVIGVAVFAMGGKKGAADTAAKPPAAEQAASKSGPAAPPVPTPPTAPGPDAVTQANATPGSEAPATPAAGPAGAATVAAPASPTAAKPKRAAAAPAKKHAPLRATRSDVPY